MIDCIFCDIIHEKIPTNFVYEDMHVVVFKDMQPKAEVHLLIVPKQHISSTMKIKESHGPLLLHTFKLMPKLAEQHNLQGFRTVINTEKAGGQEIFHIHFHLLGGDDLPSF